MPKIRLLWVVCVIAGAMFIGNASRADDAAEAEGFVRTLSDTVIQQLTDPSLGGEEQERRFRAIIKDAVAFDTISRWVLGRHWRSADEAQQARFRALFEDLMVVTYAHRFQDYGGEKLNITATRPIETDQWLVQSLIGRPGGDKDLRVDWRVRRSDGNLRIIDIMVEGLSMAQTQRSEFGSVLKNNGGNLDSLMGDLETRLAKVREDRAREIQAAAKKQ